MPSFIRYLSIETVWPEARLQNIVDDSLSIDVGVTGLDAAMDKRFMDLAGYARSCEVDGILFTCSAFGSSIEQVQAANGDIPVLKPNEAMMEEAVARGGKIGVLSVFAPTVPSIERELLHIAEVQGRCDAVDVQVEFVPDALAVLHAGDEAAYNEMIADAAEAMHRKTPLDVMVLAMFSMACAGPTVEVRTWKQP